MEPYTLQYRGPDCRYALKWQNTREIQFAYIIVLPDRSISLGKMGIVIGEVAAGSDGAVSNVLICSGVEEVVPGDWILEATFFEPSLCGDSSGTARVPPGVSFCCSVG